MIRLEIEGREYKAPFEWKDLTLRKYIELCRIEIPEKLRGLWVASSEEDKKAYDNISKQIGIEEIEKIFPEYFGRVLACLTDIPEEVIERIDGPLREMFFNRYLRHFIYSSFAFEPLAISETGKIEGFKVDPRTSFTLNGVTYYLPLTLKIYDELIPLGEESALSFAEASDIMVAVRNLAEKGAERLPMFIAVYCRPVEGEKYDEKATLKREKLFYDLDMENVWAVFFCMDRLLRKSRRSTLEYSRGVKERLQEELLSQDWQTTVGEERSTK